MEKLAVLFPGQGSQYVGMGKSLCEEFSIADNIFNEANDILGFDLKKLCFEGDLEELTKTENAQPAILTTSLAYFYVYGEIYELSPAFMAGHSLGEYTALAASGALSFADAVKLVRKRGEFMSRAGKGVMAAVKNLPAGIIDEVCRKHNSQESVVAAANYNSPLQTVISGSEDSVGTAASVFSTGKPRSTQATALL